jgi:hypothetical protein
VYEKGNPKVNPQRENNLVSASYAVKKFSRGCIWIGVAMTVVDKLCGLVVGFCRGRVQFCFECFWQMWGNVQERPLGQVPELF